MFITKKAISRRTLLRGIGTTLALPLLDGMVPALTALAKTGATPPTRFGAIYVPMGMIMENWTPKTTGAGFDLTPIMQPLAPFKNQLTVVSGLNNAGVGHPGAASAFLTDVRARGGANILAGVSMDQLIAKKIGQDNKMPSLELGLESLAMVGDCENANCGYLTTLAYSTPTTPLPAETNPREVFERLFGDPESTTPEKRMARIKANRSLLDSVTVDVADLQRRLGSGDRSKVNEYLEAVREVERRIVKAEKENDDLPPTMEAPQGAPAIYGDHAKLMFDLQALAFQSDSTRVITMMMERETSSRRFPEIGLNEPHHSTTHNPDVAARLENITMINAYQVSLFAYFLERLAKTPDGDGTLLDHSVLLYGSGLSDGNIHLPENIPIVVAGKGSGTLKGGQHLMHKGMPLANLHMSLMDKFGVQVDKLGNSNGKVEELASV
jgi:Protein of unknown function (DUF1552)